MYFVHKKPIKQLSVCFGLLFVGKGLQVWRLRSLFLLLLLYHTNFFLIEEGVEELKKSNQTITATCEQTNFK